MSKQSCFIIMPLTTPDDYVSLYNGNNDHFLRVLDELFVPAVESAGLSAIRPIVEGSEVIHSEIIGNLEIADLVLCDMSIFNPNVFFELGIRTALNKPVAMVKDNFTDKTPFDLAPINYHQYNSALFSWVVKEQIELLKDHLEACMKNCPNNPLWTHFSMSQKAEVPTDAPKADKQLSYLIQQVENLNHKVNQKIHINPVATSRLQSATPIEAILPGINKILLANKINPDIISCSGNEEFLRVYTREMLPKRIKNLITKQASIHGFGVDFTQNFVSTAFSQSHSA